MSRVACCPLGCDGLLCKLPHDKPCNNYRFCMFQSASWKLPYAYVDGHLVVKAHAGSYVLLKSGIYRHIGTNEMSQLIVNAWREAGWAPVLDSICHHPDYNPIPF